MLTAYNLSQKGADNFREWLKAHLIESLQSSVEHRFQAWLDELSWQGEDETDRCAHFELAAHQNTSREPLTTSFTDVELEWVEEDEDDSQT